MTREFKFRAWSYTEPKGMFYRVLVGDTQTDDPCSAVYDEEKKVWLEFDKHCGIIMQFINRQDKAGKDIYEDDILAFPSYDYDICAHYNQYYVVKFGETEERRFGYYLESFTDDQKVFCDEFSKGYVVTNIHEHPELIGPLSSEQKKEFYEKFALPDRKDI